MNIACISHPVEELDSKKEQQIGIGKAIRSYLLDRAGYNSQTKSSQTKEVVVVNVTKNRGIAEIWMKVALKLSNQVPERIQLQWMEEGMSVPSLTDNSIDVATEIVVIWNGLKGDTTEEVLKALRADKTIFLIDPDTFEYGYLNKTQKQNAY